MSPVHGPRDGRATRFRDSAGLKARKGAGASQWRFLGKDPVTGTVGWHHNGRTELRFADGSVDIIPD